MSIAINFEKYDIHFNVYLKTDLKLNYHRLVTASVKVPVSVGM